MADPEARAEKSSEAGDGAELPVCRICLSADGGALVAPCRCRGTMKYVHRACLRSWRLQGSLRAAQVCPVCNSAYETNASLPAPLRLALRFPTASVALGGSALLLLLSRRLQRHVAGAAWMAIVAPIQEDLRPWSLWEARRGALPTAGTWALSGLVCLTVPAMLDHALAAIRRGPTAVRLCELVLFADNLSRLHFILCLAKVRESLRTAEGRSALLHVRQVVFDALTARTRVPQRYAMRALKHDLATFDAKLMGLLRPARGDDMLLHTVMCADTFIEVLGQQLGNPGFLQRWLPFLWQPNNPEIGPALILSELLLSGPVWVVFVALLRKALRRLGLASEVNGAQTKMALRNARDLLCSVARGSRAVRTWAARLSC